jgi:parallel beta-helix repeat protein
MKKNRKVLALILLSLVYPKFSAFVAFSSNKAEVVAQSIYYISENGIADHSNASTANSIAWYFKTYGSGNTYVLNTTDTAYTISSTITVPGNAVLMGKDSIGHYTILASSDLDLKTMMTVGNGSTLQYLTIDGNREASAVLSISGRDNDTLKNCIIQNSKNDFTSANYTYTLLVNAQSTTNLVIENCTLNNAGANPKLNASTQLSKGYAIVMWNAVNAKIRNNVISSTLTCGIDFTGASTVSIIGNKISDTGLNYYSTGPIADALTAYHNWNSTASENFTIYNNVITGANNHGIHVSGDGIDIENNTIMDYYLSGIMVDDWRSKTNGGGLHDNEYSQNVTIKNNRIVGDPKSWITVPGNSNRKVYVDRVNIDYTLDYQVNYDSTGTKLPVTTANYHFPALTLAVEPVSAKQGDFQVSVSTNNVIGISGNLTSKTSATLYNLQGKLLFTEVLESGVENTIPVRDLEKGFYLLRICSGGDIQAFKIKIDS